MDTILTNFLDSFHQLDAASQAEVRAQLAVKDTRPIRGGAVRGYDYNWAALCEVLGDTRPLPTFTASYGATKFRDAMERLDTYINNSTRTKLSATHRKAMTTEVLRCLVDYMRIIRVRSKTAMDVNGQPKMVSIPVSAQTVLDHIGWLADAVDQAYPGYSEAGLLEKVVLMSTAA